MKNYITRLVYVTIVLAVTLDRFAYLGFASSYLGAGKFKEKSSIGAKDKDIGRCYLFTGPYGDFLEENESLLLIGDEDKGDSFDLEAFGTFDLDEKGNIYTAPH